MIQSLHIFRKDIRHLWPELVLYAVLLITLSLITPQTWPLARQFSFQYYPHSLASLIHSFSALAFGASMTAAGLVIIAFGLLLSEIFEGEFTAPVVGLCTLTAMFLGYRAHTLHGWNVFDLMSATESIDPKTQLLTGTFQWLGLIICFLVSSVLLFATGAVIQARDF